MRHSFVRSRSLSRNGPPTQHPTPRQPAAHFMARLELDSLPERFQRDGVLRRQVQLVLRPNVQQRDREDAAAELRPAEEHGRGRVHLAAPILYVVRKEPILYVVRKQHRHSPEDTTPLADYYIVAGRVYQAPDLASVFNSRILSIVHNLQQAFDDTISYARFHPTKGYTWDFSAGKAGNLKSFNSLQYFSFNFNFSR